jgi:hypothetical protein
MGQFPVGEKMDSIISHAIRKGIINQFLPRKNPANRSPIKKGQFPVGEKMDSIISHAIRKGIINQFLPPG